MMYKISSNLSHDQMFSKASDHEVWTNLPLRLTLFTKRQESWAGWAAEMPLFNVIVLGAYYYYLTEQNKTYEDSMLDVKNYADSQNLPYRSVPDRTLSQEELICFFRQRYMLSFFLDFSN